ncbi:hypothetical protein DFH27DRAFT_151198 [Peziza echinospora]|nr:hypothetical protein DFH27DRAFT_151198 [Peziza echinospora]
MVVNVEFPLFLFFPPSCWLVGCPNIYIPFLCVRLVCGSGSAVYYLSFSLFFVPVMSAEVV